MLILNNELNLSKIFTEYHDYLKEETQVKENVIKRYISDIRFFFFNVLFIKPDIKGFALFFETSNIKELYEQRTGSTVSASINQLLDYMEFSKRLERDQYLIIKDRVGDLKPPRGENPIVFLSQNQIDFLFSERVTYVFEESHKRDYSDYKLIAPLLWSLAYDCGMEQKHIMNLLFTDFDQKNYKIRNLRIDKNELLSEWIDLNARTFNYLQKYLDSREASKEGFLILYKDKQISSAIINKTFEILKRRENEVYLKQNVYIEILVRSGILKSLNDTNGNSILLHTKIHGTESNGQLVHSINEYLLSNI